MSSNSAVSRRGGAAILVSLCTSLAFSVCSALAVASPARHTQAIDAPHSLNAVSCVPQSTDCVVTDSQGNALDASEVSATSAASWTPWAGPSGATPSEAVACPAASLCVLADREAAEGGGGNMYYATSLSGAWSGAFEPVFGVVAVSCGSTSLCVTGQGEGQIRYSSNPASEEWFALEIGSGTMSAIDCLTASFCAVVDSTGHLHVADTAAKIKEEAGWKSSDVDGTSALHGVACTSATSCVAVDGEGNVLDLAVNANGEASVSKHDIDAMNDLTAVTCTEGFMCAAVDSDGNVFVSTDGGATWNGQLVLDTDLTSVSCASTSLCVTADTAGDVTAFASPAFPLTVFITGEGEVTSTPAGIKCSTEECTDPFGGEVTLTAAKAGADYEFAGWLGCRKASATTCTVDVTAASEVTAVFLKAGNEGSTGKEGLAGREGPRGKEGATGGEGKAGTIGATGEKGAAGAEGPAGPAGADGPAGPAGKVELVTCQKVKGQQHCTTKLVSGTVKFKIAGSVAQATLSRHGAVYAAGTARVSHGRVSLRLLPVRPLPRGKYVLTLITGLGPHERIKTESFLLR